MTPIDVSGIENAEAWAGGILPLGKHAVKIEAADDSKKSKSGYDQIVLELTNDQGSIRDWIVVLPSTLGKVRQLLEAAGVVIPADGRLEVAALLGKRVVITVGERLNNRGEIRREVTLYEPADSDVTTGDGTPKGASQRDNDIPF